MDGQLTDRVESVKKKEDVNAVFAALRSNGLIAGF